MGMRWKQYEVDVCTDFDLFPIGINLLVEMISFGGTNEGDKCDVMTGIYIRGGCMRKSSEDGNCCADAESLHFCGRSGGLGLNMLLESSILG